MNKILAFQNVKQMAKKNSKTLCAQSIDKLYSDGIIATQYDMHEDMHQGQFWSRYIVVLRSLVEKPSNISVVNSCSSNFYTFSNRRDFISTLTEAKKLLNGDVCGCSSNMKYKMWNNNYNNKSKCQKVKGKKKQIHANDAFVKVENFVLPESESESETMNL